MFKFYAVIPPEPILDATCNAGRFWKGSSRRVVSMDIDPQYKPMIVADNRKMTGIPSAKFGVVVYDPPHVGPQGRDKSKKRFDLDFSETDGLCREGFVSGRPSPLSPFCPVAIYTFLKKLNGSSHNLSSNDPPAPAS